MILLALAYAYLGGFGLQSLMQVALPSNQRAKRLLTTAGGLALVVPIIYALPMFGTWGQVRPTTFPTDWTQVQSILDEDKGDYNVLVLPWHMYQDFDWLPNRWKRLANPAPNFFHQPTISGDNIELVGSFTNSSNPVSKYVEALLRRRESVRDFGSFIAPLNARYVVLFKTEDYRAYDFLRVQSDLALAFEGGNIALFRNLSPASRAYAAVGAVHVSGLDEYFEVTTGPVERVYVLGSGRKKQEIVSASGLGPAVDVVTVRVNPVSYQVGQVGSEHLVFTLSQRMARTGWEYRGRSGLENLGMMPAFEAGPGNGTITYMRFYRVHLPLYALAVVSLIVAGVAYRRSR